MKIVVLTGSPHQDGTSFLLTERFIAGAESKGHTVTRFDVGMGSVHPCIGCDKCLSDPNKQCIFHDDMEKIAPAILNADMIVLSMPLYYFGIPAQLKAVIDRFYPINDAVIQKNLKSMLIVTGGDEDSWTMDAVVHHYEILCRYLKWEDVGQLCAKGLYVRADAENSIYPQKAYELGTSIN